MTFFTESNKIITILSVIRRNLPMDSQPIWLAIIISIISGLLGALVGVWCILRQINAQTHLNLLNVILSSDDERDEFTILIRNLKDGQEKKGDLNTIKESIKDCYDHAWFIVLFAREEVKEQDFMTFVDNGNFGSALKVIKSLITGKVVDYVT